mgnify:FL=1
MGGFLAAIPGIIGAIGSLFGGKGKKTEYANTMTPQQQQYYSQMLRMLQQRNQSQYSQSSPYNSALNTIYRQFFGQGYPGQQQQQPRQASTMAQGQAFIPPNKVTR